MKKWFLNLIRKWFWYNWSYDAEWRNEFGHHIIRFRDNDFPGVMKTETIERRVDLTQDSYRTKKYLFETWQLSNNILIKDVKLGSGKPIDISISVILPKLPPGLKPVSEETIKDTEYRELLQRPINSNEKLEVMKFLDGIDFVDNYV